MKKFFIFIAVISVILFIALITNPRKEVHYESIKYFYAEQIGVNPDGFLYEMVATQISKTVMHVDNYYIFSLTKVEGQTVGIGVFGQHFIYAKRLIKKINDF